MLHEFKTLTQNRAVLVVSAAPLAVPRGFGLDPGKPVTSSTADFRWEAVREDSVLLNGVFTGYKVRKQVACSLQLLFVDFDFIVVLDNEGEYAIELLLHLPGRLWFHRR